MKVASNTENSIYQYVPSLGTVLKCTPCLGQLLSIIEGIGTLDNIDSINKKVSLISTDIDLIEKQTRLADPDEDKAHKKALKGLSIIAKNEQNQDLLEQYSNFKKLLRNTTISSLLSVATIIYLVSIELLNTMFGIVSGFMIACLAVASSSIYYDSDMSSIIQKLSS